MTKRSSLNGFGDEAIGGYFVIQFFRGPTFNLNKDNVWCLSSTTMNY